MVDLLSYTASAILGALFIAALLTLHEVAAAFVTLSRDVTTYEHDTLRTRLP